MNVYYTRLRMLSVNFNLAQIIQDWSSRIKKKALKENCTLKGLLDEANAMEITGINPRNRKGKLGKYHCSLG